MCTDNRVITLPSFMKHSKLGIYFLFHFGSISVITYIKIMVELLIYKNIVFTVFIKNLEDRIMNLYSKKQNFQQIISIVKIVNKNVTLLL